MPKLLEYLYSRGRCIKLVAHNPHLQSILWIYMQKIVQLKTNLMYQPMLGRHEKHEQMPHGYFKVHNHSSQKIKKIDCDT